MSRFFLSNQQLCKFLIWFFSLRGIWERYRLRQRQPQNRRDDGHGRVYAWGQVTKETHTAQRHRRSTKENRASVRIAGSRWRLPRAQGLQTSAKAVSPLRFGHRAPRRHTEKGACNDAREIASYAVMVGGLLRRRSHRFYTTAERRGTAMKKGI